MQRANKMVRKDQIMGIKMPYEDFSIFIYAVSVEASVF